MKIEVIAQSRTAHGTGASRRLRNAERVPGIVYGGEKPAEAIQIEHNPLFHALKKEAFHASVLTLDIDGKKQQVLLRDIHMHPYKMQVQHVDFQRVFADKAIHMKVPLHFTNAEIAPGVKDAGGIISHVMNEINISCLPADLPEFVEVDLKDLNIGHSIHVNDMVFPKGVTPVIRKGEKPVVATVQIPRGAVEAEVDPAAATAAADVPAAKQAAPDKKEGDAKPAAKPAAKK